MKHVKRILCVLLVIAIFVGSFIGSSFLFGTGTYEIDERYLAIFDNEDEAPTYYLRKAAKDQVFRITVASEGDSGFKLCNAEGENIEAKVVRISNDTFDIAPPRKGYTKGETYRLSLDDGLKFEDEKISDTKELVFTIARDEVEEYELVDSVIELDDTVKVVDDTTIELSDSSLKTSDVIYVKEKNGSPNSFKIVENQGDGIYTVEAPAIDEVYSKLNIYGTFDWHVGGIESDEDLEVEMLENIRASEFYDSLMNVSHAADIDETISVKAEKETNTVTVEVEFILMPGEEGLFGMEKLNNQKLSLTLSEKFKMSSDIDYRDTSEWDIATHTSIVTSWDVDIVMSNDDAKTDSLEKLFTKNNSNISNTHHRDVKDIITQLEAITKDESNSKIKLFDWSVPLDKHSIFELDSEVFFYIDFSLAGEMAVSQTTATEMSYGIRSSNGEFTPYSARRVSNDPITFSLRGDTRMEAGLEFDICVEILNGGITTIGLTPRAGSYAEAYTTLPIIDSESVTDENSKYFYFEPGLFFRIDISVFINLSESEDILKEIQILNDEFPFTDMTLGTPSIPLGFESSEYTLVPEADDKTILLPEINFMVYDVEQGMVVRDDITWADVSLKDPSGSSVKINADRFILPDGAAGLMEFTASYNHENGNKYSTKFIIQLGSGTIEGLVSAYSRNTDEAEPIQGASVEVYSNGSDTLIKTEYTGSDGRFSVQVPQGTYKLRISAENCLTLETTQTVAEDETKYTEHILLIDEVLGEGSCGGTIYNALDGRGIDDVVIRLRPEWNNTEGDYIDGFMTKTNSDGEYTISDVQVGYYTVEASLNGYVTDYCNVIVLQENQRDDYDFAITPELSDDEIRVVLTWGEDPSDLDSHLIGSTPDGGSFEVYYSDKVYRYDGTEMVNLDVDDTNRFGPETITILEDINGTYTYFIHDYTNKNRSTSTAMSYSGAVVRVFQGSVKLAEYNVPTNKQGTYWTVFSIDSDYNITSINSISNSVEEPINEMS